MPQLSLKAILLGSPSHHALSAAFVPLPLHVIQAKMAVLRGLRGELDAVVETSEGELVVTPGTGEVIEGKLDYVFVSGHE